ncbi:MAG: NADH-quinone oxidoreductase subunit L [Terriglobia bacterium]
MLTVPVINFESSSFSMPLSTRLLLVALLPLLGAVLNGLLGKKLSNASVRLVACTSTGLSFLLALTCFWTLHQTPHESVSTLNFNYFHWIQAGSFNANFGFMYDPLSAVMVLVVTGIGFLIHVYSTGYMAHEEGYYRFFAYLNLFMFSMLTLVLANNFLLMFVGWEGVGLCSYLLIGFWYLKKSASDAGKKAFIVNRIGDFGFILGIFLTFWTFGTIDFQRVFSMAAGRNIEAYGELGTCTAICILLFIGAMGKSAQLPLYVWLPDAMEGPTPVSALIHAATMVTAGVYMVARCNALYVLAPTALQLVAVVGAATALFAASIGLVQNDIKKVLAYSTVSQLGYMFLGCGVGAFGAGIFHLMTHAFFKALLFLGAGSVIHAMGGEQDIRKMGGLKDKIRTTWWTMLVGTIAIAGFPPLAGFFSKDEILWRTFATGHWGLWLVAAVAAGMTSFYMFRMLLLTFYGKSRMSHEVEHHVHESPFSMTGPLQVLAIGSIVAGWVGIPQIIGHLFGGIPNFFEHFLEPVFARPAVEALIHETAGMEWGMMGVALGIAIAGYLLAYAFYVQNPALPDRLMTRFHGLYNTLLNKYWVDEIYDALLVNPIHWLSTNLLWGVVDVRLIDGAVNGAGNAVRESGSLLRRVQSGYIRSYAGWILAGAIFVAAVFCF